MSLPPSAIFFGDETSDFMPVPECRRLGGTSFARFHELIGEAYPDLNLSPLDYSNSLFNDCKAYLQHGQSCFQYLKHDRGDDERFLQRVCFSPMIQIGDCILEDTSESVKSFTSFNNKRYPVDPKAEALRSLSYNHTCYKRPDLTMRATLDSDNDLLNTQYGNEVFKAIVVEPGCNELQLNTSEATSLLKKELEISRFLPYNIISHMKLKGNGVDLLDAPHIGECAWYNHFVVTGTPGRHIAFTALYNYKEVLFTCAIKDGNGCTTHCTSGLITFKVADSLAMFMSASKDCLGFIETNPWHTKLYKEFQIINALGRGSNGMVLAAKIKSKRNKQCAIKISKDTITLNIELDIVRELSSNANLINKISEIDLHTTELMQNIFGPNILVYTTIYKKITNISKRHLKELCRILTTIHLCGIVHCDIRIANLGLHPITNSIVLIDFSAARRFHHYNQPGVNYSQGALITASPSVLREISVKATSDAYYEVYPADEAISMFYLAYSIVKKDASCYHAVDVQEVDSIWRILNDESKEFVAFKNNYFGTCKTNRKKYNEVAIKEYGEMMMEAVDKIFELVKPNKESIPLKRKIDPEVRKLVKAYCKRNKN